jgi:hypothetical protein
MPPVGFEPTISVFGASEDSSCLRLRGHNDRLVSTSEAKLLRPAVSGRSAHVTALDRNLKFMNLDDVQFSG